MKNISLLFKAVIAITALTCSLKAAVGDLIGKVIVYEIPDDDIGNAIPILTIDKNEVSEGSIKGLLPINIFSDYKMVFFDYETGKETILNSIRISGHEPSVTVVSKGIHTRIDKPSSVVLTNGQITNSNGMPISIQAQQLIAASEGTSDTITHFIFEHEVVKFEKGKDIFTDKSTITPGALHRKLFIRKNGWTNQWFLQQLAEGLSSEELYDYAGEQRFKIIGYRAKKETPESEVVISEEVLASKTLQIWPKASGSIEGIDEAEGYSSAPPIKIVLKNLYPKTSNTFVRIYKGAKKSANTRTGSIINGQKTSFSDSGLIQNINTAHITVNNPTPVDAMFEVTNLSNYAIATGKYNVEIIHKTPFGFEILDSKVLFISNQIKLNGTLGTSE